MTTWDTGTGSLGAKLRLVVNRIDSDAVANTSDINIQLQVLEVDSATNHSSPVDCAVSGSGGVSVSSSFTWSAGTPSKTLINVNRTVPHAPDGTFNGTYAGSIGATGTQGIGGPTFNGPRSISFPKLTVVPGTPTGVSAVRLSDTSVKVSWSQSSASNGQPDTNTVRQRVNGGAWSDAATISPATSVSLGAAVNQKIEYAVSAANSAGSSAWSATSAPVFTTPAAPTGVSAAKDAALDITVSLTSKVAFTEHQHVMEHGTVTGGVTTWDGSPLGTVPAGTSSFKHVAPDPSKVHVYRVFAKNTATGTLQSAKVTSNQVQLLVAPNKPSVSAIGQYADKGKDLPFGWTHNPVDTTAQTAYEAEHSTNGGSTWTSAGKVLSTTSSKTFAAGTYAADVALTVRVRTWGKATTGGAEGTGASPWSDPQTVTFKSRPVASVLSPASASTWTESALTVGLGFSQSEDGSFVRATITLNDGEADVETKVSTTLTSTAMDSQVENGGTYTVTVTVLDSHGLTSDPAVSTFTVAYTLPVAAGVAVTYLPDIGWAQLDLTIPEPGVGEAAATAVTITRTIDGAQETVYAAYPITDAALTLLDTTPTISGTNEYLVRTISADGATADTLKELLATELAWAFISTGPGFSRIVSFRDNLTIGSTPTRDSVLVPTAGRSVPIALFGENTALVINGSATLFAGVGSTPEEIEGFLLEAGRVCYRDPSGRRMFGTVKGALDDRGPWVTGFSYSVSEAS